MLNLSWARALAASAILSTSLFAGDYSKVMDVVKQAWPERIKGMAICSLEANQFALLDLVDTAKEKGLSLVIINLKDQRDMEATLRTALVRRPDFIMVIDDDPIMGAKSPSLSRLIGRAAGMGIPTVAVSEGPLKAGAALAVADGESQKILFNGPVLKRLKLAVPAGGVDFAAK